MDPPPHMFNFPSCLRDRQLYWLHESIKLTSGVLCVLLPQGVRVNVLGYCLADIFGNAVEGFPLDFIVWTGGQQGLTILARSRSRDWDRLSEENIMRDGNNGYTLLLLLGSTSLLNPSFLSCSIDTSLILLLYSSSLLCLSPLFGAWTFLFGFMGFVYVTYAAFSLQLYDLQLGISQPPSLAQNLFRLLHPISRPAMVS